MKCEKQQLKQLISDILKYTVKGSDGFELEHKETRIDEVVSNLQKLYRSAANLKNIDMEFNVDNSEQPVTSMPKVLNST